MNEKKKKKFKKHYHQLVPIMDRLQNMSYEKNQNIFELMKDEVNNDAGMMNIFLYILTFCFSLRLGKELKLVFFFTS